MAMSLIIDARRGRFRSFPHLSCQSLRVAKVNPRKRQSHRPPFLESGWRKSTLLDRVTMHNAVVERCVWSDYLSRSMDPARRRDEKHRRGAIALSDSDSGETTELSSRPKSRGSKGDHWRD